MFFIIQDLQHVGTFWRWMRIATWKFISLIFCYQHDRYNIAVISYNACCTSIIVYVDEKISINIFPKNIKAVIRDF